jgi:rhodanese-related sulfurtransferase
MTSKNSTNLIIDIRSHNEFLTEHIEGATNIPLSEILEEDNFSFLKEADQKNTTLVIIGKDLLQANASWMLLKQLGIKNLKFFPVGFNQFIAQEKEGLLNNSKMEEMNSEILSNTQVNASLYASEPSSESTQTKISPAKKVKKTVTAGGC